MALHAAILAGGSGTRFWPASTRAVPKQMLALTGGEPLLRETVARLGGTERLRERLNPNARMLSIGRMSRLKGLEAGKYRLQVRVQDHVSGKKIEVGTPFLIR